ncbi:MAG: DUF2804 domain-containing protein [Treponema sp.]|jgi:hypothetical protein|nr:DUF2804 domain-containing protein [Treponema sp.]
MPFNEIKEPVPALDEIGKPVNFGWARKPHFLYDPALIVSPRSYISESDRYILISPSHLIILEIMDNGYLGYIGMSVIPLNGKKRSTQAYTIPFPLGSLMLPKDSETGSIRIQTKKYLLNFAVMKGGARIIKVDIPRFGHHHALRGELVLSPPPDAESLTTNLSWRENRNAFRCARRSPWYVAEGVIQFGMQELVFSKGSAWGIFEWNRGVRPTADIRFWASGCGQNNGSQIGFNVGYDSADSEPGTANAFFLDGRLHKLDQVTFHISPSNWLEPWRFTSNDKRLEMSFIPYQQRIERQRMFFYSLKRRQICGFFSGKVILDDGAPFEFNNITGLAERRRSRF